MTKQDRGRPAKDKSGKTQNELAQEAGVSLSTWKKWQTDKTLSGAALSDRKKMAEIQRIETEREKAAMMLATAKMEFLPRQELERALAELAGVCDQFDAAILSELPSRLAGLTPAKIEKELGPFIDEWKEQRSDARSDTWKAARAEVEKLLRGDLKKAAAQQK
tara:strand:+ start:64 stop:552 length:489 start_codon:yes stop_codon:yes gene_type:complete